MATAHAEVSDLCFSPPPRAAGRLRRYAPASRPAETGPGRIPDYVVFAAVALRHREWEVTHQSDTDVPYRARHCSGAVTAEADDVALLDVVLEAYRPPASVRARTRGEGAAG
ncbi:hypothetical protein [Marinitenerispora sediminis]|uniref:Uncharacterized protein n=1 Tax=Marinitenerispora sediminis TaxID=1931232 RepID=A0A368T456_9ACTN|nr:hypothetical protein [Marinitenerispora sediminis]RCV49744.1 hypothetical protein DEF28_19960 [Marinitenerispora sediminis]RCV53558.1 hypothetical protein DEF23_17310 [Marinitenerispora sediminis]RCV57656.1 hypothetical protein DEF24_14870 [Marinitenerispora sediminis]